jgi:transposase InsO family protein
MGKPARATSKAVCEVLVASLSRYGVPDEVLTEGDKCFTGRFGPNPTEVLFDRILRENGISHRHTGVRSPTTTGKIERFHQSASVRGSAVSSDIPNPGQTKRSTLDGMIETEGLTHIHLVVGDSLGPWPSTPASLGCRRCFGRVTS